MESVPSFAARLPKKNPVTSEPFPAFYTLHSNKGPPPKSVIGSEKRVFGVIELSGIELKRKHWLGAKRSGNSKI
jgi:hypothetical protein